MKIFERNDMRRPMWACSCCPAQTGDMLIRRVGSLDKSNSCICVANATRYLIGEMIRGGRCSRAQAPMLTGCCSGEWRRPNNSQPTTLPYSTWHPDILTIQPTILDLPFLHTQPTILPYSTWFSDILSLPLYHTWPTIPPYPTYQITILNLALWHTRPSTLTYSTYRSDTLDLLVYHTRPSTLTYHPSPNFHSGSLAYQTILKLTFCHSATQ